MENILKKMKADIKPNKYIEEVCKATGWTKEKAKEEMDKAKEKGMPYYRYSKNQCWNLNDQEIIELNEKLEKQKVEREKNIKLVSEATGWSEEKAKEEMDKAKEKGMPYYRYAKHECWKLSDEEIVELNEKIENQKKKKQKEKLEKKKVNKHIAEVCEATGWSEEKAKEEMDKAKEKGMPYYRYAKNQCWNLNDQEIIELNEKLEKQKVEREKNIKLVSEATGWSEEKAKEEMDKAKEKGMPYYRYAKHECWKLSDEEIATLNEKLEKRQERIKQNIKLVSEAALWSEERAKEEMNRALEKGISYNQYIKNQFWKMTDEELEEVSIRQDGKIKKQKEKKKASDYIGMVCEATGWSEEKAQKEMNKAKELGISYGQYAKKYCYDLSYSELEEMAKVREEQKEKRIADNEFYINAVCKKASWTREKTIEEMDKAEALGISYLKYVQKGCWVRSKAGLGMIADLTYKDKERIGKNKSVYVQKVCEATGWSKGKAELEINKAKLNCGSSYEDYYVFKLYELSEEEQRKYVTFNLFSKMRIQYNDYFKAVEYFDDKAKFNFTFDEFINRKWFVNEDISYEKFLDKISGLDAVLVKPLTATQGIGVQKFKCNISAEDNRRLYDTLMNLDKSIVEQYIIQHEEVMKFCPTSVNTLRITTLNYNGDCRFLYSVFRMGRGAVVDNFHAGGIAATVDMKTGIVCTDAADLEGNTYPVNPLTGRKIKGFQIPNWDKIIDTCKKTTGKVSGVNLVGWDFAITPDGVDLIEGNPGASYVVAQIPNVADKIGLRSVMVDPYLDFSFYKK